METLLLTCGYCGSKLEPGEENIKTGICKCKYCLSSVVVPKNLSRIENWFNRAVELRRNGEFDKAISVYERILTEDNKDPEAHWGLALSKNGIEYVDDPQSGEKIPTCHRTKPQTILADPEYLAALKCANSSVRPVIEIEAQKIHEIQKKILEVSSKEPPYDVFISYKELDSSGQRTADSVLAQDIYNELIKKGYRVFFARKTLEGKLGQEYEPIIYAALNSAKVMVVLGTKPEHFNAVWVRNEWRRFQLMGDNTQKTLIPAYRDMFPDELPRELSSLMALDISKIGFMQELTDGINRCMGKSDERSGAETSALVKGANRLNRNAETYIKLHNYDLAIEEYNALIKSFPEDPRGWWGRIVCKTKNCSVPMLNDKDIAEWYRYVMTLSTESQKASYQDQYIQYLQICADSEADYEINSLTSSIEKLSGRIDEIDKKLKEADNKEVKAQQEGALQKRKHQQEIEKKKRELSEKEKGLADKKKMQTTGWILAGVGTISAVGGSASSIVFVLAGCIILFIGFFIVFGYGGASISDREKELADLQDEMQSLQGQIISDDESMQQSIKRKKLEKERLAEEKQTIQNQISAFQKYLDIGKERISNLFLADLCAKIGVEKHRDLQDQKLREATL